MSLYRVASDERPLLSMWFYGNHPPIGAPLFFLNSAGNGGGKNGVVTLYNSWQRHRNQGLNDEEIQDRLTSLANALFPFGMMEIVKRYYAKEDRMLAIMGLTSHSIGAGNIPYVRVGTYQGRGERYILVRPDAEVRP